MALPVDRHLGAAFHRVNQAYRISGVKAHERSVFRIIRA